jgi:hypothetical protein
VSVVKQERRCTECKRKFATANSFHAHKYRFGDCRSLEAMAAIGFVETAKGWKLIDPRTKSKRQG